MKSRANDKTLDLGTRKVSDMNFSQIVTLPKTFTRNYLKKNATVRMTLLEDGSLKLTPVEQAGNQ